VILNQLSSSKRVGFWDLLRASRVELTEFVKNARHGERHN
jgi:hypothetical protein